LGPLTLPSPLGGEDEGEGEKKINPSHIERGKQSHHIESVSKKSDG